MDPLKLQEALDQLFDQALLHHGFVNYARDYELVILPMAGPGTELMPPTLRYQFRYCVQANCVTTVPSHTWHESLDDRLTIYETGVTLDGYVWGVNSQTLYPGAELVADSSTARDWAAAVGIDFHEVRIQTNVHDLTLVFSDLRIENIPPEPHVS
ncbi:hypothetical protein [Microbispora hainanensis]|uniref:YxiG-like domain-containing protein n=1 Tax=Microbispora hainanensis TaxID=568844 RepID=A0A544Y8K9_9ACTN|nr:hypothetical protein [Microbispora hainanensis]TQS13103.1 hypothetical protein FLX08_35485 [Microbispora hainanensis]